MATEATMNSIVGSISSSAKQSQSCETATATTSTSQRAAIRPIAMQSNEEKNARLPPSFLAIPNWGANDLG